jgi:GNAT superfamily N-acetyltransferase
MKIRHAEKKDVSAIVILGNRFLKEIPTYGLKIRTEEELRKLDQQFIWVVEEKDKLVGYAICVTKKYEGQNIFTEDDKILELDEIYLMPEFRGNGIGSKLLEIIIEYAKMEGYKKFFVYSSVKDLIPIINFYQKNELKTWNVQMFKDL